jgi:hypothetical protein
MPIEHASSKKFEVPSVGSTLADDRVAFSCLHTTACHSVPQGKANGVVPKTKQRRTNHWAYAPLTRGRTVAARPSSAPRSTQYSWQ